MVLDMKSTFSIQFPRTTTTHHACHSEKYFFGRPCRVKYAPGLRTHSAIQRPPSARLLPSLKSDRTSTSGCGPGVVRSDLKF